MVNQNGCVFPPKWVKKTKRTPIFTLCSTATKSSWLSTGEQQLLIVGIQAARR